METDYKALAEKEDKEYKANLEAGLESRGIKKILPYSLEWEREYDTIVRSYIPLIKPCSVCNHPVVDGFCCTTCGNVNP
jgi:hypothetical protein